MIKNQLAFNINFFQNVLIKNLTFIMIETNK